MNLLLSAVAALALAMAGVGALRLGWPRITTVPLVTRLGLGFCVGTFLVVIILFVSYLLGIPFSLASLLLPTRYSQCWVEWLCCAAASTQFNSIWLSSLRRFSSLSRLRSRVAAGLRLRRTLNVGAEGESRVLREGMAADAV